MESFFSVGIHGLNVGGMVQEFLTFPLRMVETKLNMNLQRHYENLYTEAKLKITQGDYQIDSRIDDPNDQRLGITLLVRPSREVKQQIQHFLEKARELEPNQYYYPNSDIHITVMSIISCYQGFRLEQIDIPKYIAVIEKCMEEMEPLHISFSGLTASSSCVMVQGFMSNTHLNDLRNRLRVSFQGSTLEQSIDKRYSIQTAHSTIMRFREGLKHRDSLLQLIEEYKDYGFGKFKVDRLELVFNDWYQRKERVHTLHEFILGTD